MVMKDKNTFNIEKEIYTTQWNNIRHHWNETISATRYLSTLVIFTIFPLKFLKVSDAGSVSLGVDQEITLYIKLFLMVVIAILGTLTYLNQYNHYKRSKSARQVVVAIEKKWNLYDQNNKFIFQSNNSNYSYGKFAGGEKRISHSQVQFGFIIVITLVGLAFVWFA
ncbi:MAG: hypothetical protein ACI8PB_000039 [Desulforhopalus sp.]|jgi:hypothetical protein